MHLYTDSDSTVRNLLLVTIVSVVSVVTPQCTMLHRTLPRQAQDELAHGWPPLEPETVLVAAAE